MKSNYENKMELIFNSKTNEEKILLLNQIIDIELDKEEQEIDWDLIDECNDYIDKLDDFVPDMSNIDKKLASVLNQTKRNEIYSKPKKKVLLRVLAAAITIIVASFSVISVVAYNEGYDGAWDYISSNVSQLLGLSPGEHEVSPNVVVVKGKKTTKYKSIYKLVEKENLEILYPSYLPEGVKCEEISVTFLVDDNFLMIYELNDQNYSFAISSDFTEDMSKIDNEYIVTVNGIDFYIFSRDGTKFQALCQYSGYEYIIVSNSSNELNKIIKNLEEIK